MNILQSKNKYTYYMIMQSYFCLFSFNAIEFGHKEYLFWLYNVPQAMVKFWYLLV